MRTLKRDSSAFDHESVVPDGGGRSVRVEYFNRRSNVLASKDEMLLGVLL